MFCLFKSPLLLIKSVQIRQPTTDLDQFVELNRLGIAKKQVDLYR